MIILTTLNARYTHTSIGLRYLYANMQTLQTNTRLIEFTINESIESIAERLLDTSPRIIGIGVYIWNATQVSELISYLKIIAPEVVIVLGGPEVSYLPIRVDVQQADYIIQGEADTAFHTLCQAVLEDKAPKEQIIKPGMVDLKSIALPYAYYSDEDVAHRYIYVEASRGCPFLCEFCLSSIDEKVRTFDLDTLLEAFEVLWQRGVRNFKFIDRTFNINIKYANAILDFFLAKQERYFAHFEVIPDHFPEAIKERIIAFPKGALQFEIGIQTLDKTVSDNISRPLRLGKIQENLRFLEEQTDVHMHVDLIVGLPGESLEQFAKNLNALYAMTKCEIQIGILKKLSGTAMHRHDETYAMRYSPFPPYDVLSTKDVSFKALQEMKRFARFWDIAYNSGNFMATMPLLFGNDVFANFYDFSLWIYAQTQSTWKISLERFSGYLFTYLTQFHEAKVVAKVMIEDLMKIKGRNIPSFLQPYVDKVETSSMQSNRLNKRQSKR